MSDSNFWRYYWGLWHNYNMLSILLLKEQLCLFSMRGSGYTISIFSPFFFLGVLLTPFFWWSIYSHMIPLPPTLLRYKMSKNVYFGKKEGMLCLFTFVYFSFWCTVWLPPLLVNSQCRGSTFWTLSRELSMP